MNVGQIAVPAAIWAHPTRELTNLPPNAIELVADAVILTSGAGAEGSYVQLDASVANRVSALVINLANPGTTPMKVDIATGAVGSEVVLIQDLYTRTAADHMYRFEVDIAAGTRISARAFAAIVATILISVWEEQRS